VKTDSFLTLARRFRAIFFDSYGVLKVAGGKVEGGPELIETLRDEGIEIRVLTNDSSRSQGNQAARFRELGYSRIRSSEIITSGMMAKLFLKEKITSGKVAYLGTEASARYVLDAGCEAVPVNEVTDPDEISGMVFLDDEGFDWNTDLNAVINLIRNRNIPTIVANTDYLYPTAGGRVALATGGIARLVESVLGRRFLHFGKPDTQMFNYAFEDLNLSDSFAKKDVLMVGDTLGTDIIGGNKFGIQTCLVLSGNTSAKNYNQDIVRTGIGPDFVVDSIGV